MRKPIPENIDQIVEDVYAFFAKDHPGLEDVEAFLKTVIRTRHSGGYNQNKPFTSAGLEDLVACERRRMAKQKLFDQQQQPRPGPQNDPYYGLAIGLLEASAPKHLKGLAIGLSGIKIEEEE
jgi:hypothetical protein